MIVSQFVACSMWGQIKGWTLVCKLKSSVCVCVCVCVGGGGGGTRVLVARVVESAWALSLLCA